MPLAPPPQQVRHVESLAGLAKDAASTGRGQVAFVAGAAGSGRGQLLESAASMLPNLAPEARVVLGRHGDRAAGLAVPEQPLPFADVLTAAASGSSLLDPALVTLGPLVAGSVAVGRLVRSLRAREERLEAVDLLGRALRTAVAAEGRPLVCLVDNADQLDAAWWFNLRFPFAEQIAREMPLVLVLAVDGPERLPATPADGESLPCAAARSLADRGLAKWLPLNPLDAVELSRWLGPSTPQPLLATALEISEGRPSTLNELWHGWEVRGAVSPRAGGGWELAEPAALLPDAEEFLVGKVERCLGAGWHSRHELLPAMLACGALEGRTFTAKAVADCLEMDVDAVVDLFDALVDEDEPTRGVLRDLGSVEIPDPTHDRTEVLWRYGFVKTLEWRAARGWLDDEDRELVAAALAECLRVAYEPDAQAIAHVLADLCRIAGDTEGAKVFQRMAYTASRTALRDHALHLLEAETPRWSAWDFRDAAEWLLEASRNLDADPYSMLLQFAERAERFAHAAGDAGTLVGVEALVSQGHMLHCMGEVGVARERLERARRLVPGGATETLALVLLALGDLEGLRDDELDPSRKYLAEADALFEACEHELGRARCSYSLGHVELNARNLELARDHAIAARRVAAAMDEADLEMDALHLLGTVENLTGDHEAARACAESALQYMRRRGRSGDEAACVCLLADAAIVGGDAELGFSLASEALEMQHPLEEVVDEATALLIRGKAARLLGWTEDARASLNRSLDLYVRLGRAGQAAEVRRLLEQVQVDR